MRLGIKEKSNYEGLIEAENKRDRRQFIKAMSLVMVIGIGVIIVAIFGALMISKLIGLLSPVIEGINLKAEHIIYAAVILVSILGGIIIIEQIRDKRAEDKFLKTLYKYLPLDREDINNNGLVDYLDYLLCINSLIKEINADATELRLHERVRHDILEVMKSVYVLNDALYDIINDHFEVLVFKCDTKEKIRKLINYYLQIKDLLSKYDNIQEDLSNTYGIIQEEFGVR